MRDDKLDHILGLVIENYIEKGEPIGSKFLFSLEEIDYAPSTLRKYLNLLEKEGFLYQPYNSAGRLPTVKGLTDYIQTVIEDETYELTEFEINVEYARNSLRYIVEQMGSYVDGVVVGFLRNDEYYFLGINNILKESMFVNQETIRYLVKFIEEKELIQTLNGKLIKKEKINYTFIQSEDIILSCLFVKVDIDGFDGVISIIGPARVNYKKNLGVIKRFMKYYKKIFK